MSAHTPGPWVAFGLVSPGPAEKVGYWCKGPGAWVCVADCSHEATGNGGAPGELEANARLIAAAPKLAEALQSLLAFHEPDSLIDQATDPRLRDAHADAWAEARAALAEAGLS